MEQDDTCEDDVSVAHTYVAQERRGRCLLPSHSQSLDEHVSKWAGGDGHGGGLTACNVCRAATKGPIAVQSPDIARITLHKRIPIQYHIYTIPFALLYPIWAYGYFLNYDSWFKSEEWTFMFTVGLVASHALSFLVTRWSMGAKALITCTTANSINDAQVIRIIPHLHKGEGELVNVVRLSRPGLPTETSFTYQADKYVLTLPDPNAPITAVLVSPLVAEPTFRRLPYPVDSKPSLGEFQSSRGLETDKDVEMALNTFGPNNFSIPKPTFVDLFIEHAVAPFFVFQIFCVGLWMLDEYWYYSLFTLFMLVVFECTVVFQVSALCVSYLSLCSHALLPTAAANTKRVPDNVDSAIPYSGLPSRQVVRDNDVRFASR